MKVVISDGGSQRDIGFGLGYQLKGAVRYNVNSRMEEARYRGIGQWQLKQYGEQYMRSLSAGTLELMEGLSQGSRIPFSEILYFNVLQDMLCLDGCTTFAAVGKGLIQEGALLLKNRDSRDWTVDSPDFYENRNINVIQVLKYPGGNVTVGVATAGSTGIAMGLNKYGVATASNQGLTKDFKNMDRTALPNYRGQFQREGLEHHTAEEAAQHVLKKLLQIKTQNPGIVWFVDVRNIYVIEVAPQEFSVHHATEGFVVRANHFTMLDHLNDDNISCAYRYTRAKQLMEDNYGNINREKMMEFSMDHKNGPGENSICRHTKEFQKPVTESAGIMELDSERPEKSRISIALGSPCHAWRSSAGHFTFQMDNDIESIPKKYLDGTAYKKFIKRKPREETA